MKYLGFFAFFVVGLFPGRGVLPGVAIGSGLGTQNGELMSLRKQQHGLAKLPQIKLYSLSFTGAGVLGQGGIGPGTTTSEHQETHSFLRFMAKIQ